MIRAMKHKEKIDGPRPSKAMEKQMDEAAPFVTSAYEMYASAGENIDAVTEQLRTGIQTASSASGIAQAEALIQRAHTKLRKGQELKNSAQAAFMGSADPLGPQPRQPMDWDAIESMSSRAQNRESQLREKLAEAKSLARRSGISLISVASETVGVISTDPVSDQQENKMLDFLSKY